MIYEATRMVQMQMNRPVNLTGHLRWVKLIQQLFQSLMLYDAYLRDVNCKMNFSVLSIQVTIFCQSMYPCNLDVRWTLYLKRPIYLNCQFHQIVNVVAGNLFHE